MLELPLPVKAATIVDTMQRFIPCLVAMSVMSMMSSPALAHRRQARKGIPTYTRSGDPNIQAQAAVVIDHETGRYIHEWTPIQLPVRLLLWNTMVLLLSSITMERARRSLARDMVLAPVAGIAGIRLDRGLRPPWLALTVTLGFVFLIGQWMAWQALRVHGFHISTSGPSPFFYVLTGAHAAHLSVGIIVLLYAGVISLLRSGIEHRRIVLEVASWYWHFMGVLWLYVFGLLQFAK